MPRRQCRSVAKPQPGREHSARPHAPVRRIEFPASGRPHYSSSRKNEGGANVGAVPRSKPLLIGFTWVAVLATLAVATSADCRPPPPGQEVIPTLRRCGSRIRGLDPARARWIFTTRASRRPIPSTLVWNVTKPTLTVFRPAQGKSNGTAIIVAPGGGFRVLSFQNEGIRVAQALAGRGYTAFVLKYRLHRMPDDPKEVLAGLDAMLKATAPGAAPRVPSPAIVIGPEERLGISDGLRAVELVRSRAKEFGVSAQRVGIIGFSAGGVVAGETAIAASNAPDFVGIIYSNVPEKDSLRAPRPPWRRLRDDPLSRSAMPDLFVRWRAAGSVGNCTSLRRVTTGLARPRRACLTQIIGWMRCMPGSISRASPTRPKH